jgi:hypothetical protein
MIKSLFTAACSMMIFTSCFIPPQQAFFLSPHHATTNYYKTIPTVADSVTLASYVSGTITAGGANHRLRDGVAAFQGNFHQARQWNHFQAFYGADLLVGVYDVQPLTFPGNHVDEVWINERAGSRFQGGYGLQGGINYAVPFPRGEWRILGLEANMHREYGSYYWFRREISGDAANIIERSRMFNSFTVSSDILGDFSDGSRIGYKLSYTQSFRRLSGWTRNEEPVSGYPRYMTHTLHITINKWTGYGQLNFGSDATNVQLGFSRRILTKKRS